MSDDGALADDRVLWELLRMTPGSATPQKGILPYAVSGSRIVGSGDGFASAMHSTALIQGDTSTGSVRVMPFRAVVGSTTLFATSPIEKLRGIRSGYLVGSSSMYTTVPVSANATGNPRWTLVYAAVTPDADGDSVTVKTKDPTSGTVTSGTVVVNRVTTVVVSTVDGTAGATPAKPAAPADGAGTYYIPLAYLFIPTGFGASSIVRYYQIEEIADVLTLSSGVGGAALRPASEQYRSTGTVATNQNPSGNAANRTGAYLPSTMVGGESRFILLQLGLSPVSHLDGDIVDNTVDWRQRYFKWHAAVVPGAVSTAAFASDRNGTGTAGDPLAGRGMTRGALGIGVGTMVGCGQSFVNDYPGSPAAVTTCSGVAATLTGATTLSLVSVGAGGTTNLGPTADYVFLYVHSTTGNLMIKKNITTGCQVGLWLDATAQFSNSNTF